VLLVLKREDGGLRFLVHPELRTIVREEDLVYFETLLQDFLGRAKLHPEALFKQIFSLGVGPIVAQNVELRIADYSFFRELPSEL
jgi:hypothetical protein